MEKNLLLVLMLLLLLIGGCCNHIVNISTMRERISEYYEGGSYEKELNNILKTAKKDLSGPFDEGSAAVFDVDDTALLNYEISKKIGFGYVHDTIQEWVLSAKLPAIPQMLELYNYLKSKNVNLIFLTGRKDFEYEATLKNLIEQGYTNFDTLIVRSKSEYKLPSADFKSGVREKLTQSGYSIICTVGDQWSDLAGSYTGIKIKVPNYLYEVK